MRILLVEDERLAAQMVAGILENAGYDVRIAAHGQEALDYFAEDYYPIVITDIIMPVLDGWELIPKLRQQEKPPLILVQSSINKAQQIIEIMRLGVYDYILKPIDREEVLYKIKEAVEFIGQTSDIDQANEDMHKPLGKVLSWNVWNNSVRERDSRKFEETLFYNVKTSICQGAGFGSLVSLLSLIKQNSEKVEGKYLVDEKIMEMIFDNHNITSYMLTELSNIADIVNSPVSVESLTVKEVDDILLGSAHKVKKYIKLHKHKFALSRCPEADREKQVQVNVELMERTFIELFSNALKFSQEETLVKVKTGVNKDSLLITFTNTPTPYSTGVRGIPLEYERLVFEPFFRIDNSVHEEYNTLELGLGLTTVNHIMIKHGGMVKAFNIYKKAEAESEQEAKELKTTVNLQIPLL
jgi:CheY-like chemotaxis protein